MSQANTQPATLQQTTLQQTIASFTSIEQALEYFDIGFDSRFIDTNRLELTKRFNGYLLLTKPDDWFSGRRALKNAYCKVQRSKLDRHTRSACRGCTSCQRR
ncbi:nitrogenase-stabilizing/protective protein NifW [Photobacterium sanguinicancri]|uniref:Nitrogenase-stabilizing/protective protein NifW n=1 Tax=Photobacterium sanguinicancri TaxID=875932 RepID=A0AAW7Y4P5_9GAMM|nr:nitrogenase-stabilizing/protective protein NifW [Photobacterium sanguinicancri]MDO6541570.1 nitrogenase-stabilizing/protective protein NifW [Photobacterium sanguinicancri]